METESLSLLDAALGYLRRGISVVPLHEIVGDGKCSCGKTDCASPGKHARIRWKAYQTRLPAEDEVRRWWAKWPRANIGIIMGKVSGVFGVDCDTTDKVAWIYETCGIPATETHLSRPERPHYLFLQPDFEVPTVLVGPNVEIKGEGSLMVAPPSRHHSGFVYAIEGPSRLPAAAPARLLEEIRQVRDLKDGARLTAEQIEELCRGSEHPGRHPNLRSLVGRWSAKGMTLPEIEIAALGLNTRDRPPKSERTIIEQVRDMYARWGEPEPKGDALGDYTLAREGDDFLFDFADGVRVRVSSVDEMHGGLQGDITVTKDGRRMRWGRMVFASTSKRKEIADSLAPEKADKEGKAFWSEVLETVGFETSAAWRVGEPAKEARLEYAEGPRHILKPVVVSSGTTIVFADGGTGKTSWAVGVAVSVATGLPFAGFEPQVKGPVLYLDGEDSEENFNDTLTAVWEGFGLDHTDHPNVLRRSIVRPITHSAEAGEIRALIQREGIVLVIVDSYQRAASADPVDPEAADRLFGTLRSFGIPCLLLCHVNRADAESGNASKPIGTVITNNSARSAWSMHTTSIQDVSPTVLCKTLSLRHTKINKGRERPTISLQVRFVEDGQEHLQTILFETAETISTRKMPAGVAVGDVLKILADGLEHNVPEIAGRTGHDATLVRKTLHDLAGAGKILCVSRGGGRGKPSQWQTVPSTL